MSVKSNPEWQEHLDSLEESIEKILEPPLKLSEPFKLIEDLGDSLIELTDDMSEEAVKTDLQDAWSYLDTKHDIVRKLDDKIKAGVFELVDGPGIRYMIEKVLIPWTAKTIAKAA